MSAVVIQADRRAASPYMGLAYQRALDGQCDEGTLVEAFAAHREAHTAGLVRALEANLSTLGEERRRCQRWKKSHYEIDTAIAETQAALKDAGK